MRKSVFLEYAYSLPSHQPKHGDLASAPGALAGIVACRSAQAPEARSRFGKRTMQRIQQGDVAERLE